MSTDLDRLHTLLSKSRSKAVKKFCSTPKDLKPGDLEKIENAILSRIEAGDNVEELFDLVRKTAAEAGTSPEILSRARVVIRYPVPKNPFAGPEDKSPVRDAERSCKEAKDWGAPNRSRKMPARAFCRFLLSAIVEFRILHQDYIPAILSSLGKDRLISLGTDLKAIPLSLRFGRQQNAERRLLILRNASLGRFEKFRKMKGRSTFSKEFGKRASAPKVQVRDLIADLEKSVMEEAAKIGLSTAPPPILEAIESARLLAMFKLPSIIVAHRSRLIVSHSLPPEVLGRFGGKDLPAFGFPGNKMQEDTEEPEDTKEPEKAESVIEEDKPPGMALLRKALNPDCLDQEILNQLANESEEKAPQLLAKFANFLAGSGSPNSVPNEKGCKPATVRRYCLLIARRLFPRLGGPIEVMTADDWEDAIEQLLDEDAFFNLKKYTANPNSSAQTQSRALVTAVRHWLRFLRREFPSNSCGEELGEIEKRLPVLGLVAVDASLITVEEYLLALQRVVGPNRPDDADTIEAGRVALILGYRCGLRRSETAGLSVADFDSIDYLHVRANEMRPLKTSNAKRDLPLRLLIPKQELEHVLSRVGEIKDRAKLAGIPIGEAYLFSERSTPQRMMNFEGVVKAIHWAFWGAAEPDMKPIDRHFHYHRLRHSFCNMMLLKLQPAMRDIALRFFQGKESEQTRAWIEDRDFRKNLFGTDHIQEVDLQGIALLMGHGSAAVSLEHYTHVLDFYEPDSR